MNLQKMQTVVADQQNYLDYLSTLPTCEREEERMVDMGSRLAQVVTGVRRSGKSTLCLNVLKASSLKFAYLNFDDERLAAMTADDLDLALQALYKAYGEFQAIFLDEPQNVPEWCLFVNRLLRSGLKVLVTGSNSNLLGGELATHMTGRYREIRLLPFSFREYCAFKGVDADSPATKARALRSAAFDEYLRNGAFPEVAGGESPGVYVRTLIENVRTKDIERRYRIRYKSGFRKMSDYLLSSVPCKSDAEGLAKLFGFSSRHTAENYLEYMERSFLINRIPRYSPKPRLRVGGDKFYAVDVSFMSERDNALQGENLGWRMETIVALELLRRARRELRDVYYFAANSCECDFLVAERRSVKELYQVTYSMDGENARRREINGAVKAALATGLKEATIVTYSECGDIEHPSGVTLHCEPVWDWLCRRSNPN